MINAANLPRMEAVAGRSNGISPARALGTILLASLSWPVFAQEITVPAGPQPAELQCPQRKAAPPKHKPVSEDVLEAPTTEELGELSQGREEGPAQNVDLDGHNRNRPARPFAIALWGDSHTASGFFSEEVLRSMGVAPEKALPTFIPPDMGRAGVRLPLRKSCQGDDWRYEYAYVLRQTKTTFAKGLVNLKSNTPGSYLWVDFRTHASTASNLRSLDILFEPPANGAHILLSLSVDDGPEQIVELTRNGNGRLRLRGEQYFSVIKLRLMEGDLVLQGFLPEYAERPPVYFDTLSIPGSTVRGWQSLDMNYYREREQEDSYDLIILEYGTNEGNDRGLDYGRYKAELRDSLTNLRAAYPSALCVLIGPPDRGMTIKRKRGRRGHRYYTYKPATSNLLKYANIHEKLGGIQRNVAEDFSCAYWSWQEAMGGPGASYRWLRHSPAWMGRDITHLTVPGLQLSARKFTSDTRLAEYLRRASQ